MLLTACLPEEQLNDSVRVTRQRNQMLATRPPGSGKPALHCPLAGARPAHHRLDSLMCCSEFLAQCDGNRARLIYGGFAGVFGRVKNCALFRH